MKFACPYCHREFGPEPHAVCPACHKAMKIPTRLAAGYADRIKRKSRRAAVRRETERTGGPELPDFLVHRKPVHLFGLLIIMVLVGSMLIGRTRIRTGPSRDEYYRRKASRELDVLRIAAERFHRDTGRYPTTDEGLDILVFRPGLTGWNGPYVTLVKPDPWLQEYLYSVSSNEVTIASCGSDKTPHTPDDVFSSEFTAEELRQLMKPPAEPPPAEDRRVPVSIHPRSN